jgi:hypothetical protein
MDIVDKLRSISIYTALGQLLHEAADEIVKLREELDAQEKMAHEGYHQAYMEIQRLRDKMEEMEECQSQMKCQKH